jgi:para-nitrobenzyl esterase
VNFARSGDPNGKDLPVWPNFDPATEATMTFADRISVAPIANRNRMAFWDAFRQKAATPGRPRAA